MAELNNLLNQIKQEKDTKIIPANIRKDTTIFDITGTFTSDATAVAANILNSKTAYAQGNKVIGTMPDNGQLTYSPSDSAQTIPAGYTSGGTVQAADITQLQDYQQSLAISKQILGINS